MPTTIPHPRFIVLEGLDGSGKSTQAARLAQKINNLKIPCLCTCHPSRGPIGEMARSATKGAFTLENETLALLFAADRCQHYHEEISPRLAQGHYVVCDRYYYSNMAYQGTTAAAMERVIAYNHSVMEVPAKRPDITFFLDVPPKECMRRIISRSGSSADIGIYETLPRLEQMRECFYAVFKRLEETDNIVIIDAANNSHEAVAAQIWKYLNINENE